MTEPFDAAPVGMETEADVTQSDEVRALLDKMPEPKILLEVWLNEDQPDRDDFEDDEAWEYHQGVITALRVCALLKAAPTVAVEAALPSDMTRAATLPARQMLSAGINIQGAGTITNEVVAGALKSLVLHIDELEADLRCAVAVGQYVHRSNVAAAPAPAETSTLAAGPYRAKELHFGNGDWIIEAQYPCINGLSAWFTICKVSDADEAEIGYSDGAIGSAEQRAKTIEAALNATDPDAVAALRAQEEAEASHANCEECEGTDMPEKCPACLPRFYDARLMRRAALTKLDAEIARIERGGKE